MACLRLTYRSNFEVLKGGSKKELTIKKSVLNLRSVYFRGFNGMEKDDEMMGGGNSYDFGARMYDSRVARWFSKDLYEKKYPEMSPYSFTANNPVLNKDFDGNDWGASTKINEDGSKTITLTLTAAVLNSSNKTIDMNAFKSAVETQVKASYTVEWNEKIGEEEWQYINEKGEVVKEIIPVYQKVNVIVKTDVTVIDSKSELKDNQHLLEIVDPSQAQGIYGQANDIGGKEIIFNANMVPDMLNKNDNNTIVHELGHTFGLRHIDKNIETPEDRQRIANGQTKGNPQYISPSAQAKTPNNMMFSGRSSYMNDKTSTKMEPWQMRTGLKELKKGNLNKLGYAHLPKL